MAKSAATPWTLTLICPVFLEFWCSTKADQSIINSYIFRLLLDVQCFNSYSSNKIRKAQIEDLNIVCQNLNGL